MLETDQRPLSAPSLRLLNEVPKKEYMRIIGDVVENSPWVAEETFARRPFLSIEDLNAKLIDCISAAPNDRKIELFNRHPELAGHEAIAGAMTESSTDEQSRLGLTRLQPNQHARLSEINNSYRKKFGFPFIVALRLHDDLESVMREGEMRLKNSSEIEITRTIEQISAIVHGRLRKIFLQD